MSMPPRANAPQVEGSTAKRVNITTAPVFPGDAADGARNRGRQPLGAHQGRSPRLARAWYPERADGVRVDLDRSQLRKEAKAFESAAESIPMMMAFLENIKMTHVLAGSEADYDRACTVGGGPNGQGARRGHLGRRCEIGNRFRRCRGGGGVSCSEAFRGK